MSTFGKTERYISNLFHEKSSFNFQGTNYNVLKSGKPNPSKGECKTDIYVLAISEKNIEKEFKISFKQGNADFLENKIKLERANEILGSNAQEVIEKATNSIKEKFEDDYLIYFQKYGRTAAKCLKMGWKFEFVNKTSGLKSGLMPLDNRQKIDIYAGTNLPKNKKNSRVNGEIIENSGIANYILTTSEYNKSLQYYIDNIIRIEEYAIEQDIYFACKALNYRVAENKQDGDRPLAVYVDWNIRDEKITADLVYEQPLSIKGNTIGDNISRILNYFKISKNNFDDLKNHIVPNLKYI